MIRRITLMLMCISICSTSPDYESAKTYVDLAKEGATFLNSFGSWYKDNFAGGSATKKLNVKTGLSTTLFSTLNSNAMKILNPQTLGKLAKAAKGLLSIAGALGPIGALFSFVSIFIPTGPSDELLAIEKGFKEVNVRFDKVELKLDNIHTEIKKQVYQRFNDIHANFKTIQSSYESFIQKTTNNSTRTIFMDACRSQITNPMNLLKKLRDLVVGTDESLGNKLLDVMLEETKYSYSKVKRYFGTIMSDATTAAMMNHICLGLRFPNDAENRLQAASESQSLITDISNSLKNCINTLMEYAIRVQLGKDMNEEMKNKENRSRVDFTLHIKDFLDAKYSWLLWNVYVFHPSQSDFVWTKTSANSFTIRNSTVNTQNLMITWADRETYKRKKDFLHNLRDYLNGLMDVENCDNVDRNQPTEVYTSLVFPVQPSSPEQKFLEQLRMADTYLVTKLDDVKFAISDNTEGLRFCRFFIALSVV